MRPLAVALATIALLSSSMVASADNRHHQPLTQTEQARIDYAACLASDIDHDGRITSRDLKLARHHQRVIVEYLGAVCIDFTAHIPAPPP